MADGIVVPVERMAEDPSKPNQPTGIGMGFEKRSWEPHFRIVAMNPSGTAAKTGLIEVDMFLLEVNGVVIDNMKSKEVIDMIKGDPQSMIEIRVRALRNDEQYDKPDGADDAILHGAREVPAPGAGSRTAGAGAAAVGAGAAAAAGGVSFAALAAATGDAPHPTYIDPLTQFNLPEGPMPNNNVDPNGQMPGYSTDREQSRAPEGMPEEPFSDDEAGGQDQAGPHEEFFQSVLDDLNPFKPETPEQQEQAQNEKDPLDHEMECVVM